MTSDLIHAAFPGTMTEVSLDDFTPLSGPSLSRARGTVRRSVASCRRCALADGCSGPVPYEAPPAPSSPVCGVLGEAPGKQEDERRRPFIGPSGKLLRAMLDQVGLHPDDVMYLNTVSCFPHDGGRRARAPGFDEMHVCRVNMMSQLELMPNRYLLLVGSTALTAFRGDLKVSQVHGRMFVWNHRWIVMPIYHPAAILREKSLKKVTVEDLWTWRHVVTGEIPWHLSVTCVKCPDFIDHYDPDGVGYCRAHWQKYGIKTWMKMKKKWDDKPKAVAELDLGG